MMISQRAIRSAGREDPAEGEPGVRPSVDSMLLLGRCGAHVGHARLDESCHKRYRYRSVERELHRAGGRLVALEGRRIARTNVGRHREETDVVLESGVVEKDAIVEPEPGHAITERLCCVRRDVAHDAANYVEMSARIRW